MVAIDPLTHWRPDIRLASRGRSALATTAALALLAACTGGGGATPATSPVGESPGLQSPAETPGAESPPAQSPQGSPPTEGGRLRLWHYEGPNSAMGIAWADAMEQFEASHPGVTIEFEEKGFEQIQKIAGQVLNSDAAPDIMEYNKGNATAGLLSSQGLLTDISSVVEERGWDDLLSPSLQTTARYDERGVMGSGNWYGIPNYAEYVMVYYNRDTFAEHGVEVPTTLEDFEAVMDQFVQADTTPLAVGGLEYPAQQIFYELVLSQADRDFVNAFQLYKGEVDFHGPEFTFGAERYRQWVDNGYISTDSTSIPAEDMGVSFIRGDHPILISGSWWYGRFINEITDFEWGTFLFPGNNLHPGSSGNLWVVPERSQNKELAYDFIDLSMTPEIQGVLGNNGGVPVVAEPEAITDEKSKELITNFNTISDADGLAFYPDWPAPGYYDVLVGAVQELTNGTVDVQQFLDNIAQPYSDYRSTLPD
jgi:raffinose/stachyose/melibiose transport system substrate-binding protein